MINYPTQKEKYVKYAVHLKRLAWAFLFLGLAGVIFPGFFGLTVAVFAGWMILLSGILSAYVTYQIDKKSFWGWLKSLLLIITGGLMIFYPFTGASALAIVLAVYLFTDAALNFGLAFNLKPAVNKIWAVFNGLISAVLGVIFLFYAPNPLASSWLLGLYIGISLLFDALMMFQLSRGADKIIVEETVIEQ
jgi:uncharacterized membrane protein HdeD (DUF308 family)